MERQLFKTRRATARTSRRFRDGILDKLNKTRNARSGHVKRARHVRAVRSGWTPRGFETRVVRARQITRKITCFHAACPSPARGSSRASRPGSRWPEVCPRAHPELVRALQALLPLQHALAVPRVPDLRGERHHHDERREQTDGQRDGVDNHRASKVARPASRAPICQSKRRRTL